MAVAINTRRFIVGEDARERLGGITPRQLKRIVDRGLITTWSVPGMRARYSLDDINPQTSEVALLT